MIELLCTVAGILGGIAVVVSLVYHKDDRSRFETKPDDAGAERIQGIAAQLKLISNRVAANVNAHSERVGHFSERLSTPSANHPEEVLSTIQEIVHSNQTMQGQLADAQKRIEQQAQMIEHAAQQARTDALTGLANRRALDEFLGNCLSSTSDQEIAGLLLLDIDHFKNFNDSFGHTTGDAVLASFARSLTKCSGVDCYVARFGGEEFAVVLTGSNPRELVQKSAEIRFYVSEQTISYEDLQLKVTCSAGLCFLSADDTVNSSYERADGGLYQSKNAGRNRGFWLDADAWVPFPEFGSNSNALADIANRLEHSSPLALPAASPAPPVAAPAASPAPATSAPSASPEVDSAATSETPAEADTAEMATPAATDGAEPQQQKPDPGTGEPVQDDSEGPIYKVDSEVHDLKGFLGLLEPYLDQLRRAELSATAIMVEAIGLSDAASKDVAASWEAVVALAQLNLRGIDVVCLFRPHTLCIFMPGSTPDLAIERAAKMQADLRDSREDWKTTVCPDRLAIAIAEVDGQENGAQFLDRLEGALDEAQDATESQVVLRTGISSHFQDV